MTISFGSEVGDCQLAGGKGIGIGDNGRCVPLDDTSTTASSGPGLAEAGIAFGLIALVYAFFAKR